MERSDVTTAMVQGDDVKSVIPAVAELRLTIFREYPYLYDGTLSDELEYLKRYATVKGGMVVCAMYEGRVVGAVTGIPLDAEDEAFLTPLRTAGEDVAGCYYVGEALLFPPWRDSGLGSRLLDTLVCEVESWGCYNRLVCATICRDPSDPRKPEAFIPIDGFCQRHGFILHPDLVASVSWREEGGGVCPHDLVFWMRSLEGVGRREI